MLTRLPFQSSCTTCRPMMMRHASASACRCRDRAPSCGALAHWAQLRSATDFGPGARSAQRPCSGGEDAAGLGRVGCCVRQPTARSVAPVLRWPKWRLRSGGPHIPRPPLSLSGYSLSLTIVSWGANDTQSWRCICFHQHAWSERQRSKVAGHHFFLFKGSDVSIFVWDLLVSAPAKGFSSKMKPNLMLCSCCSNKTRVHWTLRSVRSCFVWLQSWSFSIMF